MINTLYLDDVRCFHGAHEIPVRPLTLMVGENSTGKTTFLAMLRAAWRLGAGMLDPDFNDPPYVLGAFDELHSGVRRGKRVREFVLGGRAPVIDGTLPGIAAEANFMATFEAEGAQPRVSSFVLDAGAYATTMAWPEGPTGILSLRTPRREIDIPHMHPSAVPRQFISELIHQALTGRMHAAGAGRGDGEVSEEGISHAEVRAVFDLPRAVARGLGPEPMALAPIRSQPERNYSPRRETAEPHGSHVPMILAAMSERDPKGWGLLRERLRAFGRSSGLLDDITVERKGEKSGDPFQVRVALSGKKNFNLVDVGYGVSQGLPIIVDAMLMEAGRTLLMQQPEVHLHPRAQAAIGDLCVELLREEDKRFVVETHSDYLVDRVRMRMREGTGPQPDQVVILYFERSGKSVDVHPIEMDERGNLLDVPAGYRQFFLDESRRLLGM